MLSGFVFGTAVCAALAAAAVASALADRDRVAARAVEDRTALQAQFLRCEETSHRMAFEATAYRVRSHLATAHVEHQRGHPAWAAAEIAAATEAAGNLHAADAGLEPNDLAPLRQAVRDAAEWNSPGDFEDAVEMMDALLRYLDETWE